MPPEMQPAPDRKYLQLPPGEVADLETTGHVARTQLAQSPPRLGAGRPEERPNYSIGGASIPPGRRHLALLGGDLGQSEQMSAEGLS